MKWGTPELLGQRRWITQPLQKALPWLLPPSLPGAPVSRLGMSSARLPWQTTARKKAHSRILARTHVCVGEYLSRGLPL